MFARILYLILLLACNTLAFSQKFCILADGGYSYRLYLVNDSIPNDYKTYQRDKKQGTNFSIEPVWYSEGNGFGIKYSFFRNTVNGDSIKVSIAERKSISENLNLHYIGLQYHYQIPIGITHFSSEFAAGLGTIIYINKKTEYKSVDYDMSGRTYALNASLSVEYSLSKSLSVFVISGIFISNIDKVEENGVTVMFNPRESLTRIDLNGGLRLIIF